MRCRGCDYPLWNLKARSCPECGAPFRPSEYEFVPNSVRFCCPHCEQPYFGTSDTGHLVPSAFECVRCGAPVDMDDMVLRPAEHVAEEQTRPERMPWLERKRGNRISAFCSTIGMAMIHPRRLIASVSPESSLFQAGWFALLCTLVVSTLSVLPMTAMMLFPLFATPNAGGAGRVVAIFVGGIIVSLVAGIVFTVVLAVIWIVTTHLLLVVSGQRAGGIGRTALAILYSSGANIMTAVPCIGMYFGWIWWMVSAVLMVLEGQRVHAVRATMAVCAFPLLLTIGVVVLYAGLIMTAISAGSGGAVSTVGVIQTDLLRDQLVSAAATPAHALELVASGRIQPGDLLCNEWTTTRDDVAFGPFTLEEFARQGPARRAEMASSFVEALPDDLVAHRAGDFVFTYHGVDPGQAAALWLVVLAPDPVVNPAASAGPWTVATPSGTFAIPANETASALLSQNARRAEQGLPALIDPMLIRADEPLVAERPEQPVEELRRSDIRAPGTDSPYSLPMRCTVCDYPLWNLKARACPECGEPFRPSASEFVPNSVRFCCPHCDQAYYGTGATGLLVPRAFDCVRCGAAIDMDQMVLRPAEGVEEAQTQVDTHPWTSRQGRGWAMGWLRTVGMSMVAPVRLARVLPPPAPGQTLSFALATVAIILFCGAVGPLLALAAVAFLFGGSNPRGPLVVAISVFVTGIVVFFVIVTLWGLVTHGVLLLTGKTAHPIGRTYQAICYSAGANATSAVPCIGIYPFLFVGLCWWLVSAILMVAEAQKTSGTRAALAALVFPAVLCVLGGFGLGGLAVLGMKQATIAVAQAQTMQTEAECELILDALATHRADHGGWPHHAVEVIDGATITPLDLVAIDTLTYDSDVPVGDTDLESLFSLAPGERKGPIAATIDAQPDDVVAHRFGDFVFVYHGVDPNTMDPELWLVIVSPDPDLNEDPTINGVITVGRADGTAESIAYDAFAGRLAEQNRLRGAAGLASIPMPAAITHKAPLQPAE